MAAEARTEVIDRIERYITPVLTGACSFLFLLLVPFLPGSPVLPALVSLGLAFYSARRPRGAAITFYALVFVSIVWQLVGFGLIQLAARPAGLVIAFVLLAPLLVNFLNPKLSPASLSVIFLAVAVMLTPEYYLSVPLVAAAVVMDGLASVAADASTFIFTLAPLLLVENALYFGTPGVSPDSPPIMFAQLSRVAAGIRPSLPGLNFFLTGLPQGLFSGSIPSVVAYLTERAYVLLIPLAVFAVIFSLSVSAAGILTSVRDRLLAFARLSRALKVAWPAIVIVVTTAVFAGLLIALSPDNLAGYQTGLSPDPAHLALASMMVGATVIGAALSLNGHVNSIMRNSTISRDSLAQSLGTAKKLTGDLRVLAEKVNGSAPSVGLRVETSVLDEYSSYIADIERQLPSSSVQAVSTWDGDLRARIIPTLESLPEQIRVKVVNELNSVISISKSVNNTMEHVGSGTVFPGEGLSVLGLSTDDALDTYARFTAEVKVKVSELYTQYVAAAKALDVLIDKTVSEPPVNPEVLISTQDYVTAMRLLAEDYSMTFHLEYKDELESKAKEFVEKLTLFSKGLPEEDRAKLAPFLDLGEPRPLDSQRILTLVEGALASVRGMVRDAAGDAERLASMVATLMPAATTVLKFETLAELEGLKALGREAGALRPALAQVSKLLVKAKAALEAHMESERNDGENLILVAQYPLAQRLIRGMAETKREVSLAELPFQPDAAHLYAKIYVASDPAARYDSQNETLLLGHA